MKIVKADKYSIEEAARIIKNGGVVAFPTETVYGLGANVYDGAAVRKIFEIKGRPSDNPLIVHIAEMGDLNQISNIPSAMQGQALRAGKYQKLKKQEIATDDLAMTGREQEIATDDLAMTRREREIASSTRNDEEGIAVTVVALAEAFWPGPLTLVLKKSAAIPNEVSAGLDTVAVRMPKHPVALALIKSAGVPIAAPSANLSGKPSPTNARHVLDDFGDKVFILDGGEAEVGLESTVLDLTVHPPVILRQGGVTYEDLVKVLPDIFYGPHLVGGKAKSPGMKYRHYAPKAKLFIAQGEGVDMVSFIKKFIAENIGAKVGVLATDDYKDNYQDALVVLSVGKRSDLGQCARNLFTVLRKFDSLNVDVIVAENFPENDIGAAIMERLYKASQ